MSCNKQTFVQPKAYGFKGTTATPTTSKAIDKIREADRRVPSARSQRKGSPVILRQPIRERGRHEVTSFTATEPNDKEETTTTATLNNHRADKPNHPPSTRTKRKAAPVILLEPTTKRERLVATSLAVAPQHSKQKPTTMATSKKRCAEQPWWSAELKRAFPSHNVVKAPKRRVQKKTVLTEGLVDARNSQALDMYSKPVMGDPKALKQLADFQCSCRQPGAPRCYCAWCAGDFAGPPKQGTGSPWVDVKSLIPSHLKPKELSDLKMSSRKIAHVSGEADKSRPLGARLVPDGFFCDRCQTIHRPTAFIPSCYNDQNFSSLSGVPTFNLGRLLAKTIALGQCDSDEAKLVLNSMSTRSFRATKLPEAGLKILAETSHEAKLVNGQLMVKTQVVVWPDPISNDVFARFTASTPCWKFPLDPLTRSIHSTISEEMALATGQMDKEGHLKLAEPGLMDAVQYLQTNQGMVYCCEDAHTDYSFGVVNTDLMDKCIVLTAWKDYGGFGQEQPRKWLTHVSAKSLRKHELRVSVPPRRQPLGHAGIASKFEGQALGMKCNMKYGPVLEDDDMLRLLQVKWAMEGLGGDENARGAEDGHDDDKDDDLWGSGED
ncbi:hypothetical protein M406DRAFT_72740 [Cryphonectria parasitica EP155]|uniref:Uncharacterized protein n=1 Tax=Cryphonectria parasitica (strain ATCC 38755 / EP155) TaxID=660469 RepID=A0A9P5CMC7_CRYP1|nr:uncharacterized protein M406DRAFT_72740 [Cryphonectria parasitica EP155]KAF3762755.1 hypothetical protein M406DRAFT_72740 [Cryphonectria parasitica EP155]